MALLGFGALTALFYAPVLLGGRTFSAGDFTDHFFPFSLFQRSEILTGRLPIWNPYTYAGHPFLADLQAAVFYPVSNLVLALSLPLRSDAARLYVLQVEALLHFLLAGFFTYLLVQALVGRRLAAFLSGCVFVFSGYATGYPALQLAVLRTAIWLPLVLWLLWRALAAPDRWRWWIAAALAYAAAFLAGHAQTFLYLSYVVVAWLVVLLISARRRQPITTSLVNLLARVAVFGLLFLGLSAAQLLPSLEFTRLSVRASADYAFVSGGFPLADTWQVILPRLTSLFSPLYVGIVALGLALFAMVELTVDSATPGAQSIASPASPRTMVAFFALMTAIALLVSYGRNGILFPLLYHWLPGWNLFQGQERAAYLVAFGLSVLAGLGAAGLDRLADHTRRRTILVYAGLVVVGVTIFVLRYLRTGQPVVAPQTLWQAVAVAMVAVAAATLVLWPVEPARWRLPVLTGLVLAELLIANVGVNTDSVSLPQQAALPPVAQMVQAAVAETAAAAQPSAGLPGRVANDHRVFEDYGMRAGIEDIWGSSPLRLARLDALLENFPSDRRWRLLGVQHVVSEQPELFVPSTRLVELPDADKPSYLHRLEQPNPRAWVVSTVQSLDDGAALPWLADARLDLENIALLPPVTDGAGRSGYMADGLLALPGASNVYLQRLAPNRLRAEVQSGHGGLLVVSENWLPGWHATVQPSGATTAQQAPVLRADVALLGVPIGPGQSTIDLEYWPNSVRYGIIISMASLFLLGLGAMMVWLQRGIRKRSEDRERGQRSEFLSRAQWVRWVMAAVVMAAFVLRVFHLGTQELRGDETFGYFLSLKTLPEIIRSTIALQEPHPVASYFVQHAWLALAGHSEVALRFTSAWFGVLAVALLYRLGRRLGLGAVTATLAAALMAASPYAIWHSQDARMYTISLALTLASTWLALEVLRTGGRLRYGLAYVLVSWLALQTHYFAVFVLLAQNIFVLALALRDLPMRRVAVQWLLYQVLLGALYLPWLLVAGNTLTGYRGNGDSPAFAAMWQRALSVFGVGETVQVEQRLAIAVLAGILLLIGAIRLLLPYPGNREATGAGPQARRALFLLALYLAVPLLATWISALQRPIFNERYLIAAAPPFFLLTAVAVLGWGREIAWPTAGADSEMGDGRAGRLDGVLAWTAVAALGLLMFAALGSLVNYYTNPIYSKTRGWRELAATLERYSAGLPAEKVRLVQNYPDPTLWYYYDGPVDHLVLPPAANDEARTAQEVADLTTGGVQRLVIPLQPEDAWDGAGIAQRALAEQYSLVATTQVAGWPVEIYTRPPANLQPMDATFIMPARAGDAANGIRLAALSVPKQGLIPGDVLDVYLAWEGEPQVLTGSEKVTLQLLDSGGRLVAQTDQPLNASNLGAPSTAYSLSIPWQLPPGDYRLIAALYDPAQPGAPRLLTESGADHVELAVLRR